MAGWQRLIRFEDSSGTVRFGEPLIEDAAQIQDVLRSGKLEATAFEGTSPFDLKPTGKTFTVKNLLGILKEEDVPIIKCIGLNYLKHSKSYH